MANNADMDDDDIYPENDDYAPQEAHMQDDEEEEEGEEVESDSDDDINFITDVKDEPKQDTGSQHLKPTSRASTEKKPSPTPTPVIKRDGTPQVNINQIATPQSDSRPGTDYPARHTSTLDPLNGNPIHPMTGKPIFETDLDADFPTESSKPWRKPGADITDYFNYGFDEFTWASYCIKKQEMPKEIEGINSSAQQMKMFFDAQPNSASGMNPMNAMNPMAQLPPAGPQGGMAGAAEMQQMMEWMKSNGMDPQTMPPEMAAMMMSGNMNPAMQQTPQPPSGPAGFQGGHHDSFGGGGGGGGGGGRGRGRRGRGNW